MQSRVQGSETGKLTRMSILIESQGRQYINLDNLCFITCSKIICMSHQQHDFFKCVMYRELDDLYPNKLVYVPDGVNTRLWLIKANPTLTEYITELLCED